MLKVLIEFVLAFLVDIFWIIVATLRVFDRFKILDLFFGPEDETENTKK